MNISAICDKINVILFKSNSYDGYSTNIPILLKNVIRGVRTTVSVALASEIKPISNMDKYCIIFIYDVLPVNRHIGSLVDLIVFCQQSMKENGVFPA